VRADDAVGAGVAGTPVEHHQRHAAAVEFRHLGRRQGRRGDDPVDLVLPDIGQRRIDIAFAHQQEQQHALAAPGDLLVEFGQGFRIIERGGIGNDHGHQIGAPGDQAARGSVGNVVEAARGLHHARIRFLRDAGAGLETARHGRLRHAGELGHIIRCHTARLCGDIALANVCVNGGTGGGLRRCRFAHYLSVGSSLFQYCLINQHRSQSQG